MVGGPIFARKTLSCLASETCHTRQRFCLPPLAPRRAAAGHSRSKQLVSTSQLHVAQQFGDTLTDVSTKPGQFQEQLSQDDQLLRAAVEEAVPVEVPANVLTEFEHELEEDLASVAVTLTAVTGVIIFWRGVWSLLDYFLGDSIFGDICCIFVGLTIVLGIRLSGVKVSSSFWPPS